MGTKKSGAPCRKWGNHKRGCVKERGRVDFMEAIKMSARTTVGLADDRPEQETELTPEETRAVARMNEDDLLNGLLAAANYKNDEDETVEIVINRQGKDLFSFRIHPLSEEDFNRCRKRCTKYVKSKTQAGIRVPEEVDTVRYRCMLIYEATVEADRAKIWDNKKLWKAKDLATGIEAVDLLLKAGEKNAICEKLDTISGYEMTEEEVAKNS